MKIALSQINPVVGDIRGNTKKIIKQIHRAQKEKIDLVIFPELCVCGYPPADLLTYPHFIEECQHAVRQIAAECTEIGAIVGAPTRNPHLQGKRLYNSALLLTGKRIVFQANKTLLPNYDIFDEYRYFESDKTFEIIRYKGLKLALTICEDIWTSGLYSLYEVNPLQELAYQKPDLVINISASPFDYDQEKRRRNVLQNHAKEFALPIVYVNQVGGNTDLLFDGNSKAIQQNGNILLNLKSFEEDFQILETDDLLSPPLSKSSNLPTFPIAPKPALIHDALVTGLRDYFGKLNLKKAILGLSGGIDSAITLVLASHALGAENLRAVLLPSEFSSEHSVADARQLAENLGVAYDILPIAPGYESMRTILKPLFADLPFGLAEENLQARIRGTLLMALANKFGYTLLNTSNKSETAVGYGTIYGDMCGGLAVLGDVYKTEVYELAQYINREKEIIPENSITKPPSAELRPNQKDADSLPDYEILDKILFNYLELCKGSAEIIAMGFDENMVSKVIRLVNANEWKRFQTAPILRVSPKAFGKGRNMPIASKYSL